MGREQEPAGVLRVVGEHASTRAEQLRLEPSLRSSAATHRHERPAGLRDGMKGACDVRLSGSDLAREEDVHRARRGRAQGPELRFEPRGERGEGTLIGGDPVLVGQRGGPDPIEEVAAPEANERSVVELGARDPRAVGEHPVLRPEIRRDPSPSIAAARELRVCGRQCRIRDLERRRPVATDERQSRSASHPDLVQARHLEARAAERRSTGEEHEAEALGGFAADVGREGSGLRHGSGRALSPGTVRVHVTTRLPVRQGATLELLHPVACRRSSGGDAAACVSLGEALAAE